MKKQKVTYQIIICIVLLALLAIILLPIYWSFVMSIDARTLDSVPTPPRFWPEEVSFFNYQYASEVIPILRYYGNTVFLTALNTAIAVITSLMCAYAFAKGTFPLKRFFFLFMLAVMMIPFEARMIPLYLQYSNWNLNDTWWPLILGNFAWVYGTFLAKQNMDAIPDSIRESANIDGAGEWKIFLSIILPLCGPITATMAIFMILQQWNNFLWPLIVINKPDLQVLSVSIAMFNESETARYLGPRLAVAMLGAIPMMFAFLFLQKYVVQSVMVSGIKE